MGTQSQHLDEPGIERLTQVTDGQPVNRLWLEGSDRGCKDQKELAKSEEAEP